VGSHHFLTKNFTLRKLVLKIEEVLGSHTGDLILAFFLNLILAYMQMTLELWKLDPLLLAMMISDSGSNIKPIGNGAFPIFLTLGITFI